MLRLNGSPARCFRPRPLNVGRRQMKWAPPPSRAEPSSYVIACSVGALARCGSDHEAPLATCAHPCLSTRCGAGQINGLGKRPSLTMRLIVDTDIPATRATSRGSSISSSAGMGSGSGSAMVLVLASRQSAAGATPQTSNARQHIELEIRSRIVADHARWCQSPTWSPACRPVICYSDCQLRTVAWTTGTLRPMHRARRPYRQPWPAPAPFACVRSSLSPPKVVPVR